MWFVVRFCVFLLNLNLFSGMMVVSFSCCEVCKMKKPEKEFIVSEKRPQVLFLGNGICRAFGGMSWNGLLDKLKEEAMYPDNANNYLLPMPLKAAMLTNNRLATKMRNVVKAHDKQNPKVDGYDWSSFVKVTPEMKAHLLNLIGKRFDYVLTTNYSYELEAAIVGQDSLSASQIGKMMHFHEVDHAQTRFLANTFNEAKDVPVWHVHGEARKPDSMIIGSYYYGKLLRRCVERLDGSSDADEEGKKRSARNSKTAIFKSSVKQNKPIRIGSWMMRLFWATCTCWGSVWTSPKRISGGCWNTRQITGIFAGALISMSLGRMLPTPV